MVNKGMNVGDVFEDGGLFYVVDEIVGSGYISHNISAEEKQALESKQAEPEEPESQAAPETPGETETQAEPEEPESQAAPETPGETETQAEPEASAEEQTKKPASRKRTTTKRGQ